SINKNPHKSIYFNYILGNSVGADRHNLNSSEKRRLLREINEELTSLQKIQLINENYESATFEFRDEITGLRLLHKINILSSIHDQDVILWSHTFRELARMCNWSVNAQIEVLRQIVGMNIQFTIGAPNDVDSYINTILRQKYNNDTAYKYYERLSTIRQRNFYTIRKYMKEIEDNCGKLAICLNWDDQTRNLKIHETFFNGLEIRTKLELSKYLPQNLDSVRNSIITTENMLMELLARDIGNDTKVEASPDHSKYHIVKDKYSHNENKNRNRNNKQIYCTFHRSYTHSDSECKAQSKSKQSNKQKNHHKFEDSKHHNNMILSLQEPNPIPRPIIIPVKIQDKEYHALLDTGSIHNYISKRSFDEQENYEIINAQKRTVELANGFKTNTDTLISLRFSLYEDDNTLLKDRFYVLEGLNYPFILGMEFIQKNKIILDTKNNLINIDGCEYELDHNEGKGTDNEEELLERTRICEILPENEQLNSIIKDARERNPKLGCVDIAEHEIQLNNTFLPSHANYAIPLKIKDEVKEHISELLNNDIIEEAETNFISPAFFVKKANGKLRLIIDYRNLNKVTVKAHNLRPKITDILSSLNGKKVFTKLDLNQGFYQIRIKKEDIPKTGFRVLEKTYVFKRMPFGLTNAPYTFQKALGKILHDLPNTYSYIDDILIASDDIKTHISDLKRLFNILFKHNFGINFEKCEFAKSSVTFLGHIVSDKGIKPDISKIESFKYKKPRTRKQLERLLGFINWFRISIPNLSLKTAKFYGKLKQNTFKWEDTDDEKMEKIFSEIKNQRVLHYPDLNKEFELRCDASDIGIGALLLQENKLIGVFSKKLKGSEKNYSTVEKEAFSIIEALKHFKQIVFGCHILICTDNKNLIFKGDLTRRMNRWLILLEEFAYELKHVSGKNNNEADILSRSYSISPENEVTDRLKQSRITKINESLGKLRGMSQNQAKECEKESLLKELHYLLIHPGKNKMLNTIKPYVNVKNMRKIISEICKECKVCASEKDFNRPHVKTTYVTPTVDPYEMISVDIKGPIKTRHYNTNITKNEIYLIVVTDIFSRYTEIEFSKDIHSSKVCDTLEKVWLTKYPGPKRCITDNGRQFTSQNFKKLLQKYDIEKIHTAPHNPTGNSVIERINREISVALRISRKENLKITANNIWSRINLTQNSSIGHTPYEIFFNKPIFKAHGSKFEINYDEIKNKLKEKAELWNRRELKNATQFQTGDLVYRKIFDPDKIVEKYEGPFRIAKLSRSGNNAYLERHGRLIKNACRNLKFFKKGEDVVARNAKQ
ncbi:Transposon Tf2-9 polyprotein, partial [Dictyocoela roeselum]